MNLVLYPAYDSTSLEHATEPRRSGSGLVRPADPKLQHLVSLLQDLAFRTGYVQYTNTCKIVCQTSGWNSDFQPSDTLPPISLAQATQRRTMEAAT